MGVAIGSFGSAPLATSTGLGVTDTLLHSANAVSGRFLSWSWGHDCKTNGSFTIVEEFNAN
jgi:hypothetical protein